MGHVQGDTRSLDYGSSGHGYWGLGDFVHHLRLMELPERTPPKVLGLVSSCMPARLCRFRMKWLVSGTGAALNCDMLCTTIKRELHKIAFNNPE